MTSTSLLHVQVTALLQQVDKNINRATDSAANLITDAREFALNAKKAQASIEVGGSRHSPALLPVPSPWCRRTDRVMHRSALARLVFSTYSTK